jgi:hypothetical protein
MFRDEHMNLYTIFKSAQLLERLRAFARRAFPADEFEQRRPPERVNPLVSQDPWFQGAAVSQSPIRAKGAPENAAA